MFYDQIGIMMISAQKSNVTKHDITKRGAIYESYVSDGLVYNFHNTPTSYVNKTVNSYSMSISSTKVVKLKNELSTTYNGLHNTSKTTSIVFDTYNNPLTSTTISKAGGANTTN